MLVQQRLCVVALACTFVVMFGQAAFGVNATLPAGVRAVWDMNKASHQKTPTRESICINGLWLWQPADRVTDAVPGDDWGYHKVPSPWPGTSNYMYKESQTFYPNPKWKDTSWKEMKMAWYQREIQIPADWAGRRITLYTEYLNSYAAVFIDGKKVGEMKFPWGNVEITGAVKPGGKHVLSVFVAALPRNEEITHWADAEGAVTTRATVERRGLCGDVFLTSTPAGARIGDVTVDPSVQKGTVTFDTAGGALGAGQNYTLRARVLDGGKPVQAFRSEAFTSADLRNGRFSFTKDWRPTKLWDTITPENLYTVEMELLNEGEKVLDELQPVRFGFREIRVEGRDFYLNGTRFYCFALPLDNGQMSPLGASYAGARQAMERLKKIGVNMMYTHNYNCEPGAHISFEEIMRAADDVGMLISMSQPHARGYQWRGNDSEKTNGYAEHAEFYVRMVQNHPSVAFYSMNHNTLGYSADMNPEWIDGLHDSQGKKQQRTDGSAQLGKRSEDVVRSFDSTRVIYHHSSGNMGQMFTSNFYLNFVPVQERSDWFEHWATEGVKPVFLCEYGVPLAMSWTLHRGWDKGKYYEGTRDYTNGKLQYQFCTAEWGSQFLGDRAYELTEPEKQDMRFEAKQWRANATWYRWNYPFRIHQAPVGVPNLDAVLSMYVTDNWRSYRTWGLSAYNIWGFNSLWALKGNVDQSRKELKVDWDAIQRPGFSPDYLENPYTRYDLAYRESDWEITEAGKALLRNNQPLLAYIGGKPDRFTSKDHNFVPGDAFEKQIILINNSRKTVTADCSWSLGLPARQEGSRKVSVKTGEQERIPLRFTIPANVAAGSYTLTMTVRFGGEAAQTDRFEVNVMAKAPAVKAAGRIALFDPKGETKALLDGLGVRCDAVAANADLANYDMLIVGKQALTLDGPAPDIRRVREGLKVVLFEQASDVLEKRFGFRVQEYGLRQVFERVPDHPLLAGLKTENLRDWQGQATLVSYYVKSLAGPDHYVTVEWCGQKVTRPWRAGCWGNVASVLIEKPARGNFLPIIDGGFNLQYSPLMECREGKGLILFCQMDVTGRTTADPAASQLVNNILNYVSGYAPTAERKLVYAGDARGLAHLKQAGLAPEPYAGGPLTQEQVLVVGVGAGRQLAANADAVKAFVKAGGHLVSVGMNADDVNVILPTPVTTKEAEHINAFFEAEGGKSVLAGTGPAEVMIRDPRPVDLISKGAQVVGNGVLARSADGNVVFCQLAPWEFDYKKLYHTKISYRRTSFLLNRLLANMGVNGSTPLLERFSRPVQGKETRWADGFYADDPITFDDPYRFFRW